MTIKQATITHMWVDNSLMPKYNISVDFSAEDATLISLSNGYEPKWNNAKATDIINGDTGQHFATRDDFKNYCLANLTN